MKEQTAISTKELRLLSSHDACQWLIENYPISHPDYGYAFYLMHHRSWKVQDQIFLADYYLQKIPFASSFPYEVFLSFMSINNFLKVLDKYVPFIEVDRKSLLFTI